MLDEISAAVLFLVRLIEKGENFNQEQLQDFQKNLSDLLVERFENHWFPDQPCKGQGYRCIRVNERDRRDATLERAALACGLRYEDLKLPVELTLWVDPNEVCCRFGEHRGSYCTLASFNGKENNNLMELEKIDVTCQHHKDVKSEIIPLSPSSYSVNKNRRSPGRGGSPKHASGHKGGRGPKGWMGGQGPLNGAYPPSLHSWYTLIPRWLPPSPPPCHHHNPLVRSAPGKWSQHSPNSNYHPWQPHKGTLKV